VAAPLARAGQNRHEPTSAPARKVGFSGLRGRFLLLVIGIYAVVGALSALGFLQLTERMIVRLGTGYATQYARQQEARISAKLQRELVLAQKLVDSPLLRTWARDENDPALRAQALDELESYRRLFSDRSYFFIIDSSKNYYFNNAQDEFKGQELRYVVSRDDPRSSWYFDTIKNVDDFALHVDHSQHLGLTKVWINAVVKDGNAKIGMGGSGLDLTDFLKEVVQSPDPGVETVLVNRQGFVQGHSDSTLMEKNAKIKVESQRLKIFDLIDASQKQAMEGHIATIASSPSSVDHFEIENNGHRVIVGAAYLKSIDWLALVFVDPSKVVDRQQFLPILAVVAVALLASVVLVSYAMDRLILKRLMVLTDSTQDIASGDYDVDLKIDRADEIGQLTQSFNHMTATIRDYTQNLEDKVEARTEELRQSNLLLEQSNALVMDSIHYALLIQTALLAKPTDMHATFAQSFALWLPRDVVGGDYYTLYTDAGGGFLLAVADCTGHGVPGAFMSMASKALLDRAVAAHGLSDPAALLRELHTTLQDLLRQEEPGSHNGLDIGLVHGRRDRALLKYAGARIPIWLHRPGQPIECVKGDKLSLGYSKTEREVAFTNHALELSPETRVYLASDGILDQPGGDKGFGLGQRRLQEAFLRWENVSLDDMSSQLETLIKEYAGSHPQRDDITVVGFIVGETP
jgi:serine phosphatase RsbU (regulator of sigma subunit)